MKKLTKVSLSIAAVGGILVMAAPTMAMADTAGQFSTGSLTQTQYGGSENGTSNLNLGGSLQVNQIQAEKTKNSMTASDYYNNNSFNNQNLGNGSSQTGAEYIHQYTKANDLAQQGVSGAYAGSMSFGNDSSGYQTVTTNGLTKQGNGNFWLGSDLSSLITHLFP